MGPSLLIDRVRWLLLPRCWNSFWEKIFTKPSFMYMYMYLRVPLYLLKIRVHVHVHVFSNESGWQKWCWFSPTKIFWLYGIWYSFGYALGDVVGADGPWTPRCAGWTTTSAQAETGQVSWRAKETQERVCKYYNMCNSECIPQNSSFYTSFYM